jgi:DNA-binding SARP family transcriptional activator
LLFGILGPVEVATDSEMVSIGQPRHRAVLAYLLLHPNRVITLDQVADALWGGAEPVTSRSQVHVAVSALRRELRCHNMDGVIVTRPSGYMLTLGDADLDATVFARRMALAHEDAAQLARDALTLWRGEPLTGVTAAFAAAARQHLAEERLAAYELLADAELALGRHEEIVTQLRDLVRESPMRERLVGQLMIALHRCGRGGEAMAAYERLRTHLADEYGVDPGPDLRQLHLGMLRGSATGPAHPPVASRTPRPVPRQLPAAIANFCGRGRHLAALDRLAETAQRDGVVTTVIAGTAGVGKPVS